ncbi:sensor histidine kinase [Ktedonobacter racemifer]|uniref:Integral membrane sensor signal transduction histidine kinase n=1 Tax=Ktedonobacter racemifer DSM 44963 TaxID=485913 RepID=D6TUP9_KTERA|nr:sensor histidine kinase [Ktedonobacter racemifer]EFH84117.1 integral membrane sensor signal transduction histidine kinase [Ktedonobacter racemifer DSM 44963]
MHLSGSIASLANCCYVFSDTVLLADGTSVGSDSGGSDGGEESKACYNRDSMLRLRARQMILVAQLLMEAKEERMKQLRHVRSLTWFFLFWLGTIIVYWNSWAWKYAASPGKYTASATLHLVVTLLLLIHLGVYWIGFSLEGKRSIEWLFLCLQAGLILLLTQMTHLLILALALSPLLFLIATLTLKQIHSVLLFIGGDCLLLFLYGETIGPTRDWSDIWGGGWAPGVGFLGLFFLVTLLLYVQQTKQAHERTLVLLRELDEAHAQLSTFALRIEELTLMAERQRIARDLHDTLVQGVTGLLMQLGVVRAQLRHQKVERAQVLLEQVMEQASDALADARCAIGDLRSGRTRSDDLAEVVQEETSRFTATTGLSCHADIAALSILPTPCCDHVVRVISEGLANVARHAQASAVWIQATAHKSLLTIQVRDNGVGFDPDTISAEMGKYGLLGMRERARLIGGQLEIVSTKGGGTILCFHIPIRPQES